VDWLIRDETKEELHKRELIDELINELRDAVLTGDTIYLLEKFVAALNMHEQQKQRADELEKRWHKMKAILDGVWKYGDADEHEIAYDLINRMQQLEEDNNARSE